jgi:preprotein translocase subunit YajC
MKMSVLVHLGQIVLSQGETPPPAGGGVGMMVPMLLMFGVIYFLLIRPANKQRKQHQDLLKSLKKDDEVATTGGIYGKIVSIDDREVTLEVADKVKIRVLRDRVAGKWSAGDSSAS